MALARIFNFPDVEVENDTLPTLQSYASVIAALSGLDAWWSLTDADSLTVASDKVANVAAKAGAGNLAQATGARQPAYTDGEAVFNAANSTVLAYDGTHPAEDHSVAIIIRGLETAVATQNIAGVVGEVATDIRHNMVLQTNGYLRYTVNSRYADVQIPSGGPAMLLVGDYVQSTGITRIRANGVAETLSGGAGAASLSEAFYVGAGRATGASGVSGTILDVFLFSSAIIGTAAEDSLEGYAHDVRGVSF